MKKIGSQKKNVLEINIKNFKNQNKQINEISSYSDFCKYKQL